jgi:RecB family exonuclease
VNNFYIPANADISFGQTIHKTLEKYHSLGGKTFEALFESYDACWQNDGFISPQQSFEYYERGKKLLENYFASFKTSRAKILYTEKSFDANIGKYKFVGIIDRIDETPEGFREITDYKTHVNIWEQERVDKDLQLSIYAYACRNVFGFTPDLISAYFLSANKKIYTKRNARQIEEAVNLCLETAEKITAEEFDPDVSKCAFCDFKHKCKYNVKGTEELT